MQTKEAIRILWNLSQWASWEDMSSSEFRSRRDPRLAQKRVIQVKPKLPMG